MSAKNDLEFNPKKPVHMAKVLPDMEGGFYCECNCGGLDHRTDSYWKARAAVEKHYNDTRNLKHENSKP